MDSEDAVSTSGSLNLNITEVQSDGDGNGVSFRIRDVQEINSTVQDESSSDGIKRRLPAWLASNDEDKNKKRPKINEIEPTQNSRESEGESNGNANIEVNKIKDEPQEENPEANIGTNADVKPKIKKEIADDNLAGASTSNNVPATSAVAPVIVKQEATSTVRDSCQYGIRCYRRNPAHKIELAHPGDSDYKRPNYPPPPKGTPDCPFGDRCYRRNPTHFQDYSHPPSTDFKKNWQLRQKRLRKQKRDPEFDYYDNDDSEDEDEILSDDPFESDASDDEYLPNED